MPAYVLAYDQSTQGTKAMLFSENGTPLFHMAKPHKQLINEKGWVEHDAEEIWENVLSLTDSLIKKSAIDPKFIETIGISNQRETAVAWDRDSGLPLCPAIVWQCGRAEDICLSIQTKGYSSTIKEKTGLLLSPYFSAAKWAWMIKNLPQIQDAKKNGRLCLGTVDSYLIYRMTNGQHFQTDASNASRTQLFNIHTLCWDLDLLDIFGIPVECLPTVTDSDGDFGKTDMNGILPNQIMIHGVMGDSHAALYGQNCRKPGIIKATYGTGSSIMMQTGSKIFQTQNGLLSSLAWKMQGIPQYVLEGNINYTGAIITWMKDDLGLLRTPDESEQMALSANPMDQTCLVPAFSGLGAPWWNSDARAAFVNMSRTTGKAELVKAGLESIGFQVADIIHLMQESANQNKVSLRVDGGATSNHWLMHFQSDLLGCNVWVPHHQELSCIGAAWAAGIATGIYDESVFDTMTYDQYTPVQTDIWREEKNRFWTNAVHRVI